MQRFITIFVFTVFATIATQCKAGETLAGYTPVTGTGPLSQISGQFTDTYEALYRIHISDPAAFSASTVNSPTLGVDSRLYLFTLAGTGIASNDDTSSGEMRASLPAGNPLYASLPPGDYLIGISIFDTAPYGSDDNPIFPDMTDGVNGPTSSAPLATWGDDPEGNQGSYEIDFTGVSYVTAVKLNIATAPSNGLSGSYVNLTASGVPTGTITPSNVVVSVATTCAGAPSAVTTAVSVVHILGTSYRFEFQVPPGLLPGTYFLSIEDDGSSGIPTANTVSPVNVQVTASDAEFVSGNCSQLIVES
jgi:hypothetical protein